MFYDCIIKEKRGMMEVWEQKVKIQEKSFINLHSEKGSQTVNSCGQEVLSSARNMNWSCEPPCKVLVCSNLPLVFYRLEFYRYALEVIRSQGKWHARSHLHSRKRIPNVTKGASLWLRGRDRFHP